MIDIEQYIWGFTPEGEVALIYVMMNDNGQKVFLTNAASGIVNEEIIKEEHRNNKTTQNNKSL